MKNIYRPTKGTICGFRNSYFSQNNQKHSLTLVQFISFFMSHSLPHLSIYHILFKMMSAKEIRITIRESAAEEGERCLTITFK